MFYGRVINVLLTIYCNALPVCAVLHAFTERKPSNSNITVYKYSDTLVIFADLASALPSKSDVHI